MLNRRVTHEGQQQVERQLRQFDDLVATHDALLSLIQDEIADPPDLTWSGAGTQVVPASPTSLPSG